EEFRELGVERTVETIVARLGDAPLYITIDLDVLDPSAAPAAANLEAGYTGMWPSEVTGVLKGLRGLNVIGGDVVCLVPTKDNPNNITAMNAMVLMFEMIALIADYLRENPNPVGPRRGRPPQPGS